MTRREEIQWEAGGIVNRMIERGVSQCYDTYYLAFQEGAKWADKTMIDKACECLRQSLYNTPIFEHDEDETPVNYVCASCCDSVEEFIENFRKVMEE